MIIKTIIATAITMRWYKKEKSKIDWFLGYKMRPQAIVEISPGEWNSVSSLRIQSQMSFIEYFDSKIFFE